MDVERDCGKICISCGRHLWYPWWSILFLHAAGALAHYDCAEVSSCEKFYRGCVHFCIWRVFQLDWGSWVTAIIFIGRFAVQSGFWYQKHMFWWNTWTGFWHLRHSWLTVMMWHHIGELDALLLKFSRRTLIVSQQWTRWWTFIAAIAYIVH